jgi:hypothetical protein
VEWRSIVSGDEPTIAVVYGSPGNAQYWVSKDVVLSYDVDEERWAVHAGVDAVSLYQRRHDEVDAEGEVYVLTYYKRMSQDGLAAVELDNGDLDDLRKLEVLSNRKPRSA